MKWKKWLENWDMKCLKISAGFLRMEWQPQAADMDAAWELHIEMLTRIVTQPLPDKSGDEKAALNSVVSLFPTTREIIRRYGRDCMEFSKIAIVVLNQIVRPFTAKWHKEMDAGAFEQPEKCREFRQELAVLQAQLSNYSHMLAEMAGIMDLTDLEK